MHTLRANNFKVHGAAGASSIDRRSVRDDSARSSAVTGDDSWVRVMAPSTSRQSAASALAEARARAKVVLEHIEKADADADDVDVNASERGVDDEDDARVSDQTSTKRRRVDGASGRAIEEESQAKRARSQSGASARASARASGEANGVREQDLATMLHGVMSVNERAEAINALLSERKIEIFKRGDSLVYARVREERAAKFKGLSTEDMLVYQIIQHAGNAGMWTKELKQRSNLPVPQITKIFKTLEARKLIKAVKHVTQQNRKVYMLYELEPSREITGGAWYTEGTHDFEFINVLREQCVKFIYSRDRVTLSEVSEFVRSSKLSHVELGTEEVLQIVNTLVFDGKVDENEDESQDDGMTVADEDFKAVKYYSRAALPVPDSNPYTDIPCGVCPVINECRPDGLINPVDCEYMTAWLNF